MVGDQDGIAAVVLSAAEVAPSVGSHVRRFVGDAMGVLVGCLVGTIVGESLADFDGTLFGEPLG